MMMVRRRMKMVIMMASPGHALTSEEHLDEDPVREHQVAA